MAEGTYEYECMRAELLGIEAPNYDEFVKTQKEKIATEVEEDEIDTEILKAVDAESEEIASSTGKMDELNNILAATQKKIDRFKFRCGSVTELIKTKIGNIGGNASSEVVTENTNGGENIVEEIGEKVEENLESCSQKKSELAKALDNSTNKLDSMIEKAESAQYRMQQQNKQMKSFLK